MKHREARGHSRRWHLPFGRRTVGAQGNEGGLMDRTHTNIYEVLALLVVVGEMAAPGNLPTLAIAAILLLAVAVSDRVRHRP